jgi:hypothetical protein
MLDVFDGIDRINKMMTPSSEASLILSILSKRKTAQAFV